MRYVPATEAPTAMTAPNLEGVERDEAIAISCLPGTEAAGAMEFARFKPNIGARCAVEAGPMAR